MCRFFWNFHASISHNALFEEKDGFSNKGVCQASKMYHPFGTLRRGQSENTLRVADAPKTDATVAGLWLVLLAADWPVRSSHTLSCQMCWHSSHRRRSDVADKRSCWTPYLCSSNLLQDGLSLCTWTASHCHHVLSVSIFFHLHLLYSSYYLYIYTRGHKSSAIANTPSPKTLLSPWRAAASLFLDEGWWRCMSGGIDNIYGAEWEWSIFLSGAVTPLAKLHHGQLPQQTPSFLVLLGTGPHLCGYMDTLDTVLIRQNTGGEEVQG